MSLFGTGCFIGGDDFDKGNPNPEGIVCTDAFKVSGSFAPGTPVRDADSPTGCWPVGTWTFTVSIDPTDENVQDITGDKKPDRCGSVAQTSIATFDASYSFRVDRTQDPNGDDWVDSYTLIGSSPSGGHTVWNDKVLYKISVTEGGGLDCEGNLELYSADGKSFWNLHPMQADGQPLQGFGDFVLYKEPKI